MGREQDGTRLSSDPSLCPSPPGAQHLCADRALRPRPGAGGGGPGVGGRLARAFGIQPRTHPEPPASPSLQDLQSRGSTRAEQARRGVAGL